MMARWREMSTRVKSEAVVWMRSQAKMAVRAIAGLLSIRGIACCEIKMPERIWTVMQANRERFSA